MTWPDTNPAPSLTRNETVWATSSGTPTRRTGIPAAAGFLKSSKPMPTPAAVAQRGTGRGFHDPPVLGLDHVLLGGPAHQEAALEVHVQHGVPVVVGHLEQQVVAEQAGVVDQHGGGAQLAGRPADRRLDLVGLADVGTDPHGTATRVGDLLDRAQAALLV